MKLPFVIILFLSIICNWSSKVFAAQASATSLSSIGAKFRFGYNDNLLCILGRDIRPSAYFQVIEGNVATAQLFPAIIESNVGNSFFCGDYQDTDPSDGLPIPFSYSLTTSLNTSAVSAPEAAAINGEERIMESVILNFDVDPRQFNVMVTSKLNLSADATALIDGLATSESCGLTGIVLEAGSDPIQLQPVLNQCIFDTDSVVILRDISFAVSLPGGRLINPVTGEVAPSVTILSFVASNQTASVAVPAPIPLVGAGSFFGLCRKLRKRCSYSDKITNSNKIL